MIFSSILLLFLTVALSGALVKFLPVDRTTWVKLLLAFSGAYLFTITIIHILPDILVSSGSPHKVGYYVLAGFFLQIILEVFSHGVEHGHMHKHAHPTKVGSVPYMMLVSLVIHSFLEGSIMVTAKHAPGHDHIGGNFLAILTGVAIHHIPAAFALMAVLMDSLKSFKRAYPLLLIFAVASPIGLLFSNYLAIEQIQHGDFFLMLSGLVAGNFLHISTTILFETSPEHRFNRNKILAALGGIGVALLGDLFV